MFLNYLNVFFSRRVQRGCRRRLSRWPVFELLNLPSRSRIDLLLLLLLLIVTDKSIISRAGLQSSLPRRAHHLNARLLILLLDLIQLHVVLNAMRSNVGESDHRWAGRCWCWQSGVFGAVDDPLFSLLPALGEEFSSWKMSTDKNVSWR